MDNLALCSCRLCGDQKLYLVNLSDIIKNLLEKILEESLDFQLVCSDCVLILNNFEKFILKVKTTQHRLLTSIQPSQTFLNLEGLKTEKTESDEEVDALPLKYLIDNTDINSQTITKQEAYNIPTVFVNSPKKSSRDGANEICQTSSEEGSDDVSTTGSDDSYKKKRKKTRTNKIKSSKKTQQVSKSIKNRTEKKVISQVSILDFKNNDTSQNFLDIPDNEKNSDGSVADECSLRISSGWDLKLKCQECNLEVGSPFCLKQHLKKIHSEIGLEKYLCNTCEPEIEINFYNKFLNHVITTHSDHLRYCCQICSKMFWNLNCLYDHYQNDHSTVSGRINMCLVCGKYFKKPYDLKEHEACRHFIQILKDEPEKHQTQAITVEKLFADELACDILEKKNTFNIPDHEKNADGSVTDECALRYSNFKWSDFKLNCHECSIEFNSSFELNNHYINNHQHLKVRYFNCRDCPETKLFSNHESYMNHIFTMHKEHLRYCCFVCSKMFWNYKALFLHYKKEHSRIRLHICLICGKNHKCGYDLKCHKEVHYPKSKDNETRYHCNLCSKSYNKKHLLTRHMDYHNDVKSYVCEICGKGFITKATLQNHKLCHSNLRPFECDICKETFKNKYKLKFHRTMHTDERNFECNICKQRFRAKGTLKGHYMTHSGERPFGCEYCEKKFSAKHDLVVHTRLHTGEFSHACTVCGERYPSWSNYSKHMKGRHQIDVRSEKKKKYDELHKKIEPRVDIPGKSSEMNFGDNIQNFFGGVQY